MWKLFKDYFQLNRRESNGFKLVFVLILMVYSFYFLFDYIRIEETKRVFSQEDYDRFKLIKAEDPAKKEKSLSKGKLAVVSTPPELELFEIDPNKVTDTMLVKMGLPLNICRMWSNYLSKGGRFKQKEDVKKLYAMNDSIFDLISPYLIIPEFKKKSTKHFNDNKEETSKRTHTKKKYKRKVVLAKVENVFYIDMNTADKTQWKKIKGIGAVLSKRIVAYRNRLGGFYAIDQLREVYNLPKEVIEENKHHLMLDKSKITKIELNKCSVYQLSKHPYITFNLAKSLVQYREENGGYKDLESLKKAHLLNEDLYSKIAPYLKVVIE